MFPRRGASFASFASFASRIAVALPASAVALSWYVASGCGSSTSAAPGADGGPGDASLTYVTAVTAGEGAETGTEAGNESGSSSGADSSSGDGSSSDSGDDAGLELGDDSYVPPTCNGTDPCDLRRNTCCLANGGMAGLIGTCTPGTSQSCCVPGQACTQATVHCLQALECGGTKSCCGDILVLLGQVQAACTEVPEGGSCPFIPANNTQIGVQLCKTDAECTNGQPCVLQTCMFGAMLSMCGVQSGDPLNCVAN